MPYLPRLGLVEPVMLRSYLVQCLQDLNRRVGISLDSQRPESVSRLSRAALLGPRAWCATASSMAGDLAMISRTQRFESDSASLGYRDFLGSSCQTGEEDNNSVVTLLNGMLPSPCLARHQDTAPD